MLQQEFLQGEKRSVSLDLLQNFLNLLDHLAMFHGFALPPDTVWEMVDAKATETSDCF